MGSKLTKSKKKSSEDAKTEKSIPVEKDWSTSTWPRKQKPDFNDPKSGTLGRKSRFGKGSTATLGNESKLERRPSFGKRIRASARNWASTRGLYKGPKTHQEAESESKPNSVILGQVVKGKKDNEEVAHVEKEAMVASKELDVGALVKEMVTESIIKKKLSDTSGQKVEAQIEDDGDKEDYEPVFVNNDAEIVMSEVCNVEFEPVQLVATCDVVITTVDTDIEKMNAKDEVGDNEATSTIENVEDGPTSLPEVSDVNETPEIAKSYDSETSIGIKEISLATPSKYEALDVVTDNISPRVEIEENTKTLDIENKNEKDDIEKIRETVIDEDICVAGENIEVCLKIEDPTVITTEYISQHSSMIQEDADQNPTEDTRKINILKEAQNSTHDIEIEDLSDTSMITEEVENATKTPSGIIKSQLDSVEAIEANIGNGINIPVLSEMEPHLEDLLSKRRIIIEENVPSEDLERENKPSEIILEPRLEDLMLKRRNIIEENLPSDDLEKEEKPSEIILEPELEDLMWKRRNITEENAPAIDLEKEKKASEIILEPQLDNLLLKRRIIIDEYQVSSAIAGIEETIQDNEISNSDQKEKESTFIEEAGIEVVKEEESLAFVCKDTNFNCTELPNNEENHVEQDIVFLETKLPVEKVEVFDIDVVLGVSSDFQDDKMEFDIDENAEAYVGNREGNAITPINEKSSIEELVKHIEVENEEANIGKVENKNISSNIDIKKVKFPVMCTELCAPYYHGKFCDMEESTAEESASVVEEVMKLEDNEDKIVMNPPIMCNSSCAPAFHRHISSEETDTKEVNTAEGNIENAAEEDTEEGYIENMDEDNKEDRNVESVDENVLSKESGIPTKMCTKQCAPAYHKVPTTEKEIDKEEHVLIPNKHENVTHLPNIMCSQDCAPNFHTLNKVECFTTEDFVESEKEKDYCPVGTSVQDGKTTEEDLPKNEEDYILQQKIKDLSGIIGDTLKLVQEQISETSDEINEIEKSKIIDSHIEVSEDGSDGERTDISTDEGIVASSDDEETCKDDKQEKEKLSKNLEEITKSVD